MPDTENGFYRATRFEWSGIIASLEYEGHSYFGQWFREYNPISHESILGPVQAFAPLGFGDAGLGGNFVKIGVGVLKRPDEMDYRSQKTYEIVDYGEWSYEIYDNRVEFIHTLTDEALGYSYVYHKTVSLSDNKPELVLDHRLINTGLNSIESNVYNHNFFMIDNEPSGPGIRIVFPYDVFAEGRGFGTLAEIDGKELKFLRQLEGTEHVYSAGILGFGDTADDYDFRIENVKTGAGVRITGDRPYEKLVFWANVKTYCPEPYISLSVQPGREVRWRNVYEFYTNNEDRITN